MAIIKALTISQPYASLIARGEKWIENRHWPTSYRGRLAIHAGKGTQYLTRSELRDYPTGCVIAVCQLLTCLTMSQIRLGDVPQVCWGAGLTHEAILGHEHAEGPWCWILTDVRALRCVCPCRGAQGLWDWDEREMMESVDR